MRVNWSRFGIGVTATLAVLSTGCGGGQPGPRETFAGRCPSNSVSGSAVVPKVAGLQFDVAVSHLLARHLLISVPRFAPFHDAPAEQGWGRLENYRVLAQSPVPGVRVGASGYVVLTLNAPVFPGPYGSMTVPSKHPRYATIPDLVGQPYMKAMSGSPFKTGIFVRVGQTGPLSPQASACGLNGFVVASQTPNPGTRVRWGGINKGGVSPSLATVTVNLASLDEG